MSTIDINTKQNGQKQVFVTDAKVRFKNFSGKETAFNKKGDRNFNLILTEADAKLLETECDFVIKKKEWPAEENRDPEFSLKVKIKYNDNPARFIAKTYSGVGRNKRCTTLNEQSLAILDVAEISTMDLVISPFYWKQLTLGTSGVTAYANAIHAIIEENPFEDKYARYMSDDE